MKNILITLIALLLVLGCKKGEDTFYLSDEVKRNFSFKPGSYWIYRDSISGREDSCYLNDSKIQIVDNKGDDSEPSFVELISLHFYQKPLDTSINDKMEIWLTVVMNKIGGGVAVNNNNARSLFGLCLLPINEKNLEINKFKNSIFLIDKINILGADFHNLYEIRNGEEVHFINETAGIVKMKIVNDTSIYVWELIRYKIIK